MAVRRVGWRHPAFGLAGLGGAPKTGPAHAAWAGFASVAGIGSNANGFGEAPPKCAPANRSFSCSKLATRAWYFAGKRAMIWEKGMVAEACSSCLTRRWQVVRQARAAWRAWNASSSANSTCSKKPAAAASAPDFHSLASASISPKCSNSARRASIKRHTSISRGRGGAAPAPEWQGRALAAKDQTPADGMPKRPRNGLDLHLLEVR